MFSNHDKIKRNSKEPSDFWKFNKYFKNDQKAKKMNQKARYKMLELTWRYSRQNWWDSNKDKGNL